MIKYDPNTYNEFECPKCKNKLELNDKVVSGMRILADLKCMNCQEEYWGDFPVGHGVNYSFYYSKKTKKIYPENYNWYSNLLKSTIESKDENSEDVKIRILKESKKNDKAILLNCLDNYYGHVILKLLNAQFYLDNYTDHDLVVIVPKFLTWMVPEEVNNIIEVDISLRESYLWINDLNMYVEKIIKKYKRAYLSKAYSHPHPKNYNISRFVGVSPFNLDNINKEKLTITYIWRSDRIIYKDKILYKLARKLNLEKMKNIYIWRQKRYIEKLYFDLNNNFSDVDFAVVGPNKIFDFNEEIKDLRVNKINKNIEINWCKRYANSQIIVGIHGSNMLLPSALAGFVIELLPQNRLGNYLQDILFRDNDARDILYRNRFLPLDISRKKLSKNIIGLIKNYNSFKKNMITNCHCHTIKL